MNLVQWVRANHLKWIYLYHLVEEQASRTCLEDGNMISVGTVCCEIQTRTPRLFLSLSYEIGMLFMTSLGIISSYFFSNLKKHILHQIMDHRAAQKIRTTFAFIMKPSLYLFVECVGCGNGEGKLSGPLYLKGLKRLSMNDMR